MARGRKKVEPPPEAGAPAWMVSFCDLTQQMLCFFILLFGMSQVDPVKVTRVAETFREYVGGPPLPQPAKSDFFPWAVMEFRDILKVGGAVVKSIAGTDVTVEHTREGMRITAQGEALFQEGSAEISARGKDVIREMCILLAGSYNKLEVRGYTAANVEDSTNGDHWLLGFQRAHAVARLLTVGGVAEARVRLASGGHNDPIVPNLLPEKRGRNRRVELIVSEEIWQPNE